MRILVFLLCLLSASAFGQGVAVRSSSGFATNLTVSGLNPTNPAVVYLRTNGLDTLARAGDITRPWQTWSNAVGALRSGYTLDVGVGNFPVTAMVGAASGGSILINKSNVTIRGHGLSSRITWTNHGNIVWGTNIQNLLVSDLTFYGPSNHNSASFSAGATENEGVFYIVGSGTNFASSNLFFSRIYGYNIPDFFFLDFTDARNTDNVTLENSYFENVGWTNAAWLAQPDGGVMFVHRRAKIRNVTTAAMITQAIETDTGAFSFPGERDASIDIEGCYFGGLYHRGVSVYYGTGGYIQQYIRIADTIFEGGNVMAPVSRQMAYIGTGKRVDISNCEFRHWPLLDAAHGIPYAIQIQPNLTNMADVKIRNCIFTEVYAGVVVIEGNGYNVTNFIASDNIMNDIGLDGFQCYGGDGLKFLRNTIINFGTNLANRAMVYLYQDATFTNSCTDVELIGNSASDTKGTPTGGYLLRTTGTHSRIRHSDNKALNLANADPFNIDTASVWGEMKAEGSWDWSSGNVGIGTNYAKATLEIRSTNAVAALKITSPHGTIVALTNGSVALSGALTSTNGLASFATNIVSAVNAAGYTNSPTAPGTGTGVNMNVHVVGTSGTIVFYNRSGVNGQTVCGTSLWTNTTAIPIGMVIPVPVNCGIQIVSGVGVIMQAYAQ